MQRLYRIIIYILIVVCCQSELKSQTFILGVDIKEQLWHYLYQRKEVLDSLPPFHTEPLYYESNGIVVNRTPECTENGKENAQKSVTTVHRKW